jgi:hypothetical protein
LRLVVYGSSGDPDAIDMYHHAGAHEVVIGIGGDPDDVLRQLDTHRSLITRCT